MVLVLTEDKSVLLKCMKEECKPQCGVCGVRMLTDVTALSGLSKLMTRVKIGTEMKLTVEA